MKRINIDNEFQRQSCVASALVGYDSVASARSGLNAGVSFPKLMFGFRLKCISNFEQM